MASGDFRYKVAAWMEGRNGSDDLARAVFALAIICVILQFVFNQFHNTIMAYAGSACAGLFIALLAYYWFRVLSKNIAARQRENREWVKRWSRVCVPARRKYSHFKEWKKYHKEYRFYTCKTCKQSLKVPKGKGKIRVKCPKCQSTFETKS